MRAIRILADDLTGALDTAGCFATAESPLPVVFDPALVPEAKSCAVSTGSRDLSESDAVAAIDPFLPILPGHEVAFKKIDSLLRGHIAAEIAHHLRRGDFDTAVIAPAFPALDRMTRNGRQWAKLAGQQGYHVVGPDLVKDFARFGIDLKRGLPGRHAGSPQVYLVDAETDDDLKDIVDSGIRGGRVLWCGCAGLAEVLAGSGNQYAAPLADRVLVICGTRHSVAQLQIEYLCSSERSACVALNLDYDVAAAAHTINGRLRSGRWATLAADFPELSADAGRAALAGVMKALLPKLDRPDALIVMGGDTLAICCGALDAKSLAVRGLLARGIPVSEFSDGAWKGMTVISKSGAFGAEDILARIMEMTGTIGGDRNVTPSRQSRPKQKAPSH